MNITDLRQRLVSDGKLRLGAEARLELDAPYLASLQRLRWLLTADVLDLICPYFPGGGILLSAVRDVSHEGTDRIVLEGKGEAGAFFGLLVTLEMALVTSDGGPPSLVLDFDAGSDQRGDWNVARAFPLFEGSLLAKLQFAMLTDPSLPRLTLTSRRFEGAPAGLSLRGLLDLDSLVAPNHRLLLGAAAHQQLVLAQGQISAANDEYRYAQLARPRVLFGGALPKDHRLALGALARLENIAFAVAGAPRYDSANGRWQAASSLTWRADLVLGSRPEQPIPVGVVAAQGEGRVRLFADLSAGLTVEQSALGELVPGAPLTLPDFGFELSGAVRLRRLDMQLDATSDAPLLVDFIHVGFETSEQNSWVLVDHALRLDAVDLDFWVYQPLTSRPVVEAKLSGLVGIGEKGVLRLSSSFAVGRGDANLTFSGQLEDSAKLSLRELLSHFRGGELDARVPELVIESLMFSATPRAGRYSAATVLYGEWPLAAGKLVLRDVAFNIDQEGENQTAIEARGRLELAETTLFVAASYASGGQGWTFEGGTAEGSVVPIGQFYAKARELFGSNAPPLPAPIAGLTLGELRVRFNTATEDFSFHGTAAFPIDGDVKKPSRAALEIDVELRHPVPGSSAKPDVAFGGRLHLFQREFAVNFDRRNGAADLFVASYGSARGDKIELRDFVAAISARAAALVPERLSVTLAHALLAFANGEKPADPARFLFGIELGAGIELSRLPLAGRYFAAGQTLAMAIQLIIANANFSRDEITRINGASVAARTKLPAANLDVSAQHLFVHTALTLGGRSLPLSTPLAWHGPAPGTSQLPIVAGSAAPLIEWFPVQQAFGAFHFERVGIGLTADRKSIEVLLDASLKVGDLRLTLAGLGAECALSELSTGTTPHPTFHLDGIGLDFQSGDLAIAGGLLRTVVGGVEQYDGAVTVHSGALGFVGVGSYSERPGEAPSLFLYALVDYPIGGPSFFFVEGLAFAFGYNRSLVMPAFEDVASFPLVALAAAPEPDLQPLTVLGRLRGALAEAEGEYFVAAGVKFNSFGVFDGTLLLAVVFGRRLEIDVLGAGTLTSPPRSEARGRPLLLAAKLGLSARYQPEEGVLAIQGGLLPDAYLFAPACHLAGGFAFCSWLKDQGAKADRPAVEAGDFVLTLGGYHSAFRPPPHYPKVPRLELSWEVNENLSIKGDAYFALTPAAMMAGGHVRANWRSGKLHASFSAGLDCLVAWQPYHYEAKADVAIDISYRTSFHTFTIDLIAELEIWGPPFSLRAHVDWWICSFDITYNGDTPRQPPPLTWSDFQTAFLPKKADLLRVAATAGKSVSHGKSAAAPARNQRNELGTLNPRELCLRVDSAIPITNGTVLGTALARDLERLGVAPLEQKQLDSRVEIAITFEGKPVNDGFRFEVEERSLPLALWGKTRQPATSGKAVVRARTGFVITARPIPPLSAGEKLAPRKTNAATHTLAAPLVRGTRQAQASVGDAWSETANSLQQPKTRSARRALLDALLPGACLPGGPLPGTGSDFSGVTVEMLRAAPQLVTVNP